MLRAVLALGGTAAGLAALLSFKTHVPGATSAAPPPAAPATAGAAPAARTSPKASTSPKAGTSQGATAATASRTVTGTVANTAHGPMQVQVTLAGQKITKVTVLQQTNDGSESVQIDSFAIPKLKSETLVAQSAHINTVSGASYTSSGYIQSLQSALDQASA
jgi:uncharacterized protein with FMN-binding domain